MAEALTASPITGKRKTAVKTVICAGNFTNIGGIDNDVLIPLLTDVVNGHSSLMRLNDNCALVKANEGADRYPQRR